MVTTRYKLDKGVAFDSFEEIPTKVGNDNKSQEVLDRFIS